MFFIFLMTAALGGFLSARGFSDGDYGVGFLGIMIVAISVIANGVIGFPGL